MKPLKVYPSLEAFYKERGGLNAAETDSGVHNTDDLEWDRHQPQQSGLDVTGIAGESFLVHSAVAARKMRVSTIETTGDTYAICDLGPNSPVLFLGTLYLPEDHAPLRTVSEAFSGYADNPGLGSKLSWFMLRIERHNAITRPETSQ